MPRSSTGSITVRDNRLAIVEKPSELSAEFSRNGLVETVAGGFVIRTGLDQGTVNCQLRIEKQEPEMDGRGWDEIVDLSWTAEAGSATADGLRDSLPPWPGSYRVRVCADGRDRAEDRYRVAVWAAPPSAEVVHKATDRVGALLRGEPSAVNDVEPPGARFRWITKTALADAGTVTVTLDSTPDQVIRAFGGDPAEPISLSKRLRDYGIDPWVAVLAVGPVVVAMEFNGWQGAQSAVLHELSAGGRAASIYWSVNNSGTVSVAEAGEVLGSGELGMQQSDSPELAAALEGLDLDDFRDTVAKGFVAVERLTGFQFRPEHLDTILAADVAYPILPRLPGHHTQQRTTNGLRWQETGPLGTDLARLLARSDQELRELA